MAESDAADAQVGKPTKTPKSIGGEISKFTDQIDGLAETLPLAIAAIEEARKTSQEELLKYFEEECRVANSTGEETSYVFEGGQQGKVVGLVRRVHRATLALQLVPRGLLVALVSQFDAYVGGLIRQLFKLRPEMVDSSANTLTFEQLVEFGSIEVAREYVIDKEIESVLRQSHADQFEWLEKKFNLPLRKDLASFHRSHRKKAPLRSHERRCLSSIFESLPQTFLQSSRGSWSWHGVTTH